MKENTEKLMLITIFASEVIINIEDKFFKQKIFSKLQTLLGTYLDFNKEANVAQYKQSYSRISDEISNFLETLDYIIYSNSYNSPPLLKLKRRILDFKLTILRGFKKSVDLSGSREEKRGAIKVEKIEALKLQVSDINLENKSVSSKEKILDFIRKSKKTRTKDLIEEFSAFSKRTVKRTLKELTTHGVLKREEADRAVYYSIIN